ncbi:MAG: MBL fold metallo-hydrolase [Desulfatibacillaceae bacterium]
MEEPQATITILGSGTAVPSLARSSCSVLLRFSGHNLLFDMGTGTIRRLLEAGCSHKDVTHVFFSHLHTDHTGEFPSFLFACRAPTGHGRDAPFAVLAGKGFLDFYNSLKRAWGAWVDLDESLMPVVELSTKGPDSVDFDGFRVDSLPVEHTPQSVAFRVTIPGGKSMVYTGDTDECDAVVDIARGADVLITEAALPDELRVPGHLSPSVAGALATRAGVGKLVLTHFYPECEGVDVAAQCRKTWDGPLVLATDLLEIIL